MSSITKSIQNEYVLLMENAFSEKYKYAFRNLELKELRRFILKELISSPELDNQLTNLIVLLNKFWDTHAAALITEVRASKSYRLLLPIQRFGYNISNHLRSLGIYFDSIIMVDPLHFPSLSSLHSFLSLPPDNSYVRMRRLVLLEHVSNLLAGANQQNSRSVTAGKGSNLWARSFLTYTNPAALTCLLNVLVNLT